MSLIMIWSGKENYLRLWRMKEGSMQKLFKDCNLLTSRSLQLQWVKWFLTITPTSRKYLINKPISSCELQHLQLWSILKYHNRFLKCHKCHHFIRIRDFLITHFLNIKIHRTLTLIFMWEVPSFKKTEAKELLSFS